MALDVEAVTVEGTGLRHVPAGADPAIRPVPPSDNRWQRGRVVDALYLADSPECAWAEWYRHLAERAIPPHVALPRDLWRYTVTVISFQVANLADPDRLSRVNLPPPQPGRRSWPPYQAVGEQLHHEGWPGLLAPSAARPASTVLVVFLYNGSIPTDVAATNYTRMEDPPIPPTGMRT